MNVQKATKKTIEECKKKRIKSIQNEINKKKTRLATEYCGSRFIFQPSCSLRV